MSVPIPSEVIFLLNTLGLPYPDIDADQVRELGGYVRDFAVEVRDSHESATGAMNDMGTAYAGRSYEALLARWATMSSDRVEKICAACDVVSSALDVAADVIEAIQVAVLVELVALAASYTALFFVPGGAATGPIVREVAKRLLKSMQDVLIGYLAAEVLGKAIEPLEDEIERLINGTLYDKTSDLLRVPEPPSEIFVDPDQVRRYADVVDHHGDAMQSHSQKFLEKAGGLTFRTPGHALPETDWSDYPGSSFEVPPGGGQHPVQSPHGEQGPSVLPPQSITPAQSESPPARDSGASIDESSGARPPAAPDTSGADPSTASGASPSTAAGASPSTGTPSEVGAPAEQIAGSSAVAGPASDIDTGGVDGDRAAVSPESSPVEGAGPSGQPVEAAPVVGATNGIAHAMPPGPAAVSARQDLQGPAAFGPSSAQSTPSASASGKTQGGAGDRALSRPVASAQQSSGRAGSRTPWSRSGRGRTRATPVAAESGPNIPAVSAAGTSENSQQAVVPADPPAQAAPGSAPRVFVPGTSPPPPVRPNDPPTAESNDKEAESGRTQDAEPDTRAKPVNP
ncbi:WXG100-like domain-containing protein [Nocardia grenadensis]|uniref:WXG100-like domain-containing protein n=1 Tax=Nocardia grenadensis TaxID=931537 RepID=UPI000B32FBC3|nr:hypothetical protein [Nocardia grenadensis]